LPTTWAQLWEDIERAARVFESLGLRPGDRVAIMARTCREWFVFEIAAFLCGAAVVGIDLHASPDQAATLLKHCKASALIVDDEKALARVNSELTDALKFTMVIFGRVTSARRGTTSWDTCLTTAAPRAAALPGSSPNDVAVIIYTSGTTGAPKGVPYSHETLVRSCWAMLDEFSDLGRERVVCWLPMSALFQRMMNLLAVATGSTIYFVEDPREIVSRLPEIRPTVFSSVPRFYEKLYEGIHQQLAGLSGLKKRLAAHALTTGDEWFRTPRDGRQPPFMLRLRHAISHRLVLRRMCGVMGGELRLIISGSSAAPMWLLEFFHGIGLPILEAYGITENPVPIAANRPSDYRLGSVGKPFAINQVRITQENEVLVKGPTNFSGYLDEAFPAERFTSDGFYRTGDFGYFDADGFLYLTGREADLIKTSGGRRVAPASVEGVYRQSRFIDQIVVIGNDRPHLVALVALNVAAVRTNLASAGVGEPSPSEYSTCQAVIDLLRRDFEQLDAAVARHERIRAFAILDAPFSIDNGELTTTLKPRRAQIEARHRATIDALYDDARFAVGGAGQRKVRHG